MDSVASHAGQFLGRVPLIPNRQMSVDHVLGGPQDAFLKVRHGPEWALMVCTNSCAPPGMRVLLQAVAAGESNGMNRAAVLWGG